jgi:hypothetical protein
MTTTFQKQPAVNLPDTRQAPQPVKSNSSKKKKFAAWVRKFEETKQLLAYFYPDQDPRPHLMLRSSHICDIMNIERREAAALMNIVRGWSENRPMERMVLAADFCDYFDIDETLMHIFLRTQKGHVPIPL